MSVVRGALFGVLCVVALVGVAAIHVEIDHWRNGPVRFGERRPRPLDWSIPGKTRREKLARVAWVLLPGALFGALGAFCGTPPD